MKASELIKELQKNIDKNGDLDIYIENLEDSGVYYDVNAIKTMNEIYTGIWNPSTRNNTINQKIFLIGNSRCGEFLYD